MASSCSDFIIMTVKQVVPMVPIPLAGGATSPASAPPAGSHTAPIALASTWPAAPQPSTPPTLPPTKPKFVSPPPNDVERVDASHDEMPLRYRGINNVLGPATVPGQAPCEFQRTPCSDQRPKYDEWRMYKEQIMVN